MILRRRLGPGMIQWDQDREGRRLDGVRDRSGEAQGGSEDSGGLEDLAVTLSSQLLFCYE